MDHYAVLLQVQINTALSDDETADDGPSIEGRDRYSSTVADEYDTEKTHVAEFLATFTPLKGGPFSAVIPSLIPQDMVVDIRDNNSHSDVYRFVSRRVWCNILCIRSLLKMENLQLRRIWLLRRRES